MDSKSCWLDSDQQDFKTIIIQRLRHKPTSPTFLQHEQTNDVRYLSHFSLRSNLEQTRVITLFLLWERPDQRLDPADKGSQTGTRWISQTLFLFWRPNIQTHWYSSFCFLWSYTASAGRYQRRIFTSSWPEHAGMDLRGLDRVSPGVCPCVGQGGRRKSCTLTRGRSKHPDTPPPQSHPRSVSYRNEQQADVIWASHLFLGVFTSDKVLVTFNNECQSDIFVLILS